MSEAQNVSSRPLSPSKWVWCGYAGHFIAASSCLMHLHTRVGDYRISTVGDYRPRDSGEAQEIGASRKYETFVFRVTGHGEHGEGEVSDWSEIWSDTYNEPTDAEVGHMAMCKLFARVTVGLEPEPVWEYA